MQTKKGDPLGAAAYVYAVHVTACACARACARPLMRATGTDMEARATHIDAHSPTARRRAAVCRASSAAACSGCSSGTAARAARKAGDSGM